MPLGKYYCDYCDKQFQDTPAARRRHLQGVQHQRARALWYDSIRHQGQPETLLFPFPFPFFPFAVVASSALWLARFVEHRVCHRAWVRSGLSG
jgi:hypothetical protein